MTESMFIKNSSDDCLRTKAAKVALDYVINHITPSSVIGIGTGATVEIFVELLSGSNALFAHCVSSSARSSKAIQRVSLEEQPLEMCDGVDFYVDGIDEGLVNGMTIKGGGAALAREKILASVSNRFITIADRGRLVDGFGHFPLPIEILPVSKAAVLKSIQNLGGNSVLRSDCITDNGNLIIDVSGLDMSNPEWLEERLNRIPGVVENGIFAHRKADFMAFSDEVGTDWNSVCD